MHEHLLDVREVSDDLPDRHRKLADQRRDRDDVVFPREPGVFAKIYDFDRIPPAEMLGTDPLEVPDRSDRSRRLAGYVEHKPVFLL